MPQEGDPPLKNLLHSSHPTWVIAELLESPGRVSIGDFGADLGPSVQHLTFEYEPLHLNRFAGASRLPALTVAWFNQHYRPFSEAKQLDQELQRHDAPFDGFGDLALALGIPVGFDDLNKRRFSEVVLLPRWEFWSMPMKIRVRS